MKRSHHKSITRSAMLALAVLALGWGGPASAQNNSEKCEADKLKASSNKAKCLLRAEAEGVLSGQAPDISQCVADFEAAFAAAEAKAGPGVCPTEGDVAEIEDLLDACAADVAGATVLTGSCTAASSYWSSTTFAGNAWFVVFNIGTVLSTGKGTGLRVRAVRGGSE